MDLSLWLALGAGLPLALFLYVRANDAKIATMHPDAVALSPHRWTPEEIKRTAEELEARYGASPSLLTPEELPPKTGRRYIVIGGVSVSSSCGCPATYARPVLVLPPRLLRMPPVMNA